MNCFIAVIGAPSIKDRDRNPQCKYAFGCVRVGGGGGGGCGVVVDDEPMWRHNDRNFATADDWAGCGDEAWRTSLMYRVVLNPR